MSEPSTLSVRDLSFRLSSEKMAFDSISFELREGELLALLGPNGCGKSTLLKTVAGIASGNVSGQVQYRDQDFFGKSPSFRARTIAYVGHDYRTDFPMTSYEAVMLARSVAGRGFFDQVSSRDREVVEWAIDQCLCREWKNRDLQTLSTGERQLVGLARALAQGARILFLDEALSQMDLHHQAQMGKFLKSLTAQGYSVILVSHDVNLAAEWADTAFLMKSGKKLAHGKTQDVLITENFKSVFPGADLHVGKSPMTGAPKIFFGKS